MHTVREHRALSQWIWWARQEINRWMLGEKRANAHMELARLVEQLCG